MAVVLTPPVMFAALPLVLPAAVVPVAGVLDAGELDVAVVETGAAVPVTSTTCPTCVEKSMPSPPTSRYAVAGGAEVDALPVDEDLLVDAADPLAVG
jgi:hypothetical protein